MYVKMGVARIITRVFKLCLMGLHFSCEIQCPVKDGGSRCGGGDQMAEQLINSEPPTGERRYEKLHRPAKEFKSRSEYLDHELQITNLEDKRWGFLKPGRDFRFEWEDLIPAVAATIGSSVLSFGIIGGYVSGFGLPAQLLLENVRLELVLVGLIIMGFMFLNPRLGGIGHHGWMIPLVPAIVAAGGHPLAMGLVMGGLGLLLSFIKGGAVLQALTPNGVIAGLRVNSFKNLTQR